MIFLDTTYINGLILKNDVHSRLSKSIEPFLENESKIMYKYVKLSLEIICELNTIFTEDIL